MTALALAILAVVSAVLAHRSASRRDAAALARERITFAASLLALAALLPFHAARPTGAAGGTLLAAAAIAALLCWNALWRLVAIGTRRRDLVLRLPLLAAAVIVLAANGPWLAIAICAGLASVAYRWKERLPTRRLFLLALLAPVLAVAGFWRVEPLPEAARDALAGPSRALWSFATAVRWTAAFHAAAGAFALLFAFVRDPSLGVRTVGRRLALSHVLVALVPLVLMGLLWAATTVLGVSRDRAVVAARAIEGEAAALETALHTALAGPGDPAPRLRALGASLERRTPGARVWRLAADRLERVYGPPVPGEAGLAGWIAGLDTLPGNGVVGRRDGAWLGAAVRADGRSALVLVPPDSAVERVATRFAGAEVRLQAGASRGWGTRSRRDSSAADSLGASPELDSLVSAAGRGLADAREESLAVERIRRITRRFGLPDTAVQPTRNRPQGRWVVDGETYEEGPSNRRGIPLFDGYALAAGLREQDGRWRSSAGLVSVTIAPGRVLAGLFENRRQDAFGWLPLVLLGVLGCGFALVAIWNLIMVTNMGRGVADAIGALHGAARRLEAGDLAHRVDVRGDDDLWDVARALNQAAAGLERARDAEQERVRLENELALARRIQARLLPDRPPRVPGLEVAGASESAREVGGDYFDHIDLGGGRVALVIADVSGKGVGAALLMSAFRASLVSHDLEHADPAALAGQLNGFLHRSVDPGKFVTAFVGFLDAASGTLTYVNAGHNPPVLLRAAGGHEWLSEGGTILGILPVSAFASGVATLGPGDLLALYTDGVTEGADASGGQWGEERLLAALARLRSRPCGEIVRELVSEVRAFEGESGPADDITVLIARRER